MLRYQTKILALSSLTLLLCACSNGAAGIRESLGIDKEIPDEFTVVTQAPLEMPSDLTLPPPNPGQARPQATSATTQAQQAVFGSTIKTKTGASDGEALLLSKTGGDNAQSDIRAIVNQETEELKTKNQTAFEKLMKRDSTDYSLVDAKKEAERIRAARQNGQAITTGETPILTDDDK